MVRAFSDLVGFGCFEVLGLGMGTAALVSRWALFPFLRFFSSICYRRIRMGRQGVFLAWPGPVFVVPHSLLRELP